MSGNQTIITIDENSSNQRFDRFLRKYCKNYPTVKLTDIYSAIRKGEITINSRKSKEDYRLQI
jgi:23S rRNA pseudouridine955/2504/2580 synthase